MTLYEKIKNMSIDEMTEYLTCLSIGSRCTFFQFTPKKDFIKSLSNYEEFYNKVKSTLMEEREEVENNETD